jgi:hypothetical protein
MMADPVWDQHDVVILTNQSPRPSYEVYVRGILANLSHSLTDAKAWVDLRYGSQSWRRVRLPKINTVHYYFGPTTEFTSPTVYWAVDELRENLGD